MVAFGEGLPSESTAATMRVIAFVLTVLGSALLANAQEEISVEVIARSDTTAVESFEPRPEIPQVRKRQV
jgi:hypothetical protein